MEISDYKSNEKCGLFAVLFCLTKLLKSLSVFLSYDVLKVLPISLFLLASSVITSIFLILLQKPFTTGQKLKLVQYWKLFQYSVLNCLVQVIIFSGLSLCGPLRFILIFEHNETVVLSILSCIFLMNSNNTTKSRGTFIYICAIFSILFLDHDHDETHNHEKTNGNLNNDLIVNSFLNKTVSIFGLSDHKLGVILLIVGLLLDTSLKQVFSKKISHNIGGYKRLNAFTYIFSALIWLVVTIISHSFGYYESKLVVVSDSFYQSYWHIFIVILFICLIYGVLDFYITSLTSTKCGNQFIGCYGNFVMGLMGLFLSLIWNHPYMTNKTMIHKVIIEKNDSSDHDISAGVLFSQALIIYSCFLLASSYNKSRNKGNFVGYSKSGLPLYTFATADDFLHRTSHSIVVHIRKTLVEILSDDNSRRIFYYLCINLGFAFVELFYGFLTNSLALISDGFHMLFDSTAIVMGLYAAVVSRWKPTKAFSYGYHRAEALSGFINGLFLVVISISVCCNGIGRLIHPPEVSTERLMVVSVLGLLVNLFGIMALGHSHGHSHGGGSHGHSHGGGGHGHSHGGGGHGHSHGGNNSNHNHGHSHNGESEHDSSNMRGVYLHVLADTLGSVGVIFSSFLMEHYGWYIADPICSLFISILIFRSVLPLISQTLSILTLQPPNSIDDDEQARFIHSDQSIIVKELLTIDQIIEIRDPLIWQHTSNINCCCLRLFLNKSANEQEVLDRVIRCMRYFKFDHITIQLEKESFELHMTGLGNHKTNHSIIFDRSSYNPQIVVINSI